MEKTRRNCWIEEYEEGRKCAEDMKTPEQLLMVREEVSRVNGAAGSARKLGKQFLAIASSAFSVPRCNKNSGSLAYRGLLRREMNS